MMMSSGEDRSVDSAEHSSAAEAIAGNKDLLREILLRLPVKSLLRFESVSKEWLSLISNPHFAQSYTHRCNPNLKPSNLLLNHQSARFQFVPFNDDSNGDGHEPRVKLPYPDDPGIMIFQSYNGLLLCSSTIFTLQKARNHYFEYYICNPTTKQFSTLRFPTREFMGSLVAVNLAFDPLQSPHYKLICIHKVNGNRNPHNFRIDIYSSETHSLRNPASRDRPLTFTAQWLLGVAFRCPIYYNGAIHWSSARKTSLYFDTHTERLKKMPMPPFHEGFDFNYNVRYFRESRGHLHIIVTNKHTVVEFDILELKIDYSGWFVRYRVNLDAVMATFKDITWNFSEQLHTFSVY